MPKVVRTRTAYMGIDPGASGAIAVITNKVIVELKPLGASDLDIWTFIDEVSSLISFAVLERVGGFVPARRAYGGNNAPGHMMFNFGRSFGKLEMALTASAISHEEITPQKWQKGLGIPPRRNNENESVSAFKRRLRIYAQRLYPETKITLATADAILIATYAKRKCEGTL